MVVSETGTEITVTGGTVGARLDPAHIIAESTSATLGGTRTIVSTKHIIIDGIYADTGWHYEFSDGRTLGKGENCNWISGIEYHGIPLRGFTMSHANTSTRSFNRANGGSVTWKNVRIETRSSQRSDFNIEEDDTTDYDIDGLKVLADLGDGENHRLQFDTGTIKNVVLPRCVLQVGGTGTLENVTFSGIQQVGEENKVFPRIANYHLRAPEPYIETDGARLALGAHTVPGDNKKIFVDDAIVPTWWDWTTDLTVYQGPVTLEVTYLFSMIAQQGDDTLEGVRVLITNDDDSTSSLETTTDSSGAITDQRLVVYEGRRASSANTYVVPTDVDDYALKTVLCRRADLDDVEFGINMTRLASNTVQFFQDDAHFTGTVATAEALTGITPVESSTTLTISEAHTLQEVYNYFKWWLSQEDQMSLESPISVDGGRVVIDGWTINIDEDLTITDALHSLEANTITLGTDGSFDGSLIDSTGITMQVKTNPGDTLVRIEEFDAAGTTLVSTKKGTSNSSGVYIAKVAADAMLKIFVKKHGYAFDETDHDMTDGVVVDISVQAVTHVDPTIDISAYVGESGTGTTNRLWFNYNTTSNKGEWIIGEVNLSGNFRRTACILDERISTQDGLEFYSYFIEQDGTSDHLGGHPYEWSHDRLEIHEDYMEFIRISGMDGDEISRLGVPVKEKDGTTDYIAPSSQDSRVIFDNTAILVPQSTLEDIVTETRDAVERTDGPLQAVKADVIRLKKNAKNKRVVDTTTNTETLYDDDGSTSLQVWDLKDARK